MGRDVMTKDVIYIPDYDWTVEVFSMFTCDKVNLVMDSLESAGCDIEHLHLAYENMMSCGLDTGLTFSSIKKRFSVVVIYTGSSASEYINTTIHEIAHVCAHISKSQNEEMDEEDFCELFGDISGMLSNTIIQSLTTYYL